MNDRYISRIGLAQVVLGVLSVAFWWPRSSAPTPDAKGVVPPVQREASPVAVRPPMAAAAATPSDRADTSEKTTITPDATAGQATTQQPATAAAPAAIAASIARFADASIPVSQRMAEIDQLGQRGDAAAMQILMKLGDTYTYLSYKAVETLANIKTPEVAKYLAGKTTDNDPRIVSCAVQSLARVQGSEAVAAIAEVVAANRQRPDGFQDMVCAAGVKALGEIGSAQAIPPLAEEFEKNVGKTLQHEYGSQVVAALKAIGDRAGVPALEGYAARLRQQKDAMSDNPMGQRYLEGKIKEVEDTVAFIKARVM